MKIVKNLIIFCVVCCAAAAPVSAYQRDPLKGMSRELSKGFDKIVELMNSDSDHGPLIKEMAILAFERKVAKEIAKKQKSLKNSLESIESLRYYIKEIRNGDYDHWFNNQEETIAQQRQNEENESLADIEKILEKIPTVEKDIAQYTEFLNKIQALKNAN